MDDRATQRSGYPLTIPEALLSSEAMRQACAARNFQEIFRLVNRRTGSGHAAMAAAVGKMTSSRVSDIIRGVRGIRGHEVIERLADGFGIPGEILGLPRRPWEGSPEGVDGTSNACTSVVSEILPTAPTVELEAMSPLDRRTLLKGGIVAATLTGAGLEEFQHVSAALEDAHRYLDSSAVQ